MKKVTNSCLALVGNDKNRTYNNDPIWYLVRLMLGWFVVCRILRSHCHHRQYLHPNHRHHRRFGEDQPVQRHCLTDFLRDVRWSAMVQLRLAETGAPLHRPISSKKSLATNHYRPVLHGVPATTANALPYFYHPHQYYVDSEIVDLLKHPMDCRRT